MSVLIVTSVGDIEVDLHTTQCPLTTTNFLKLCKAKYYNGCPFHTVHKGFIAQTGDPTGTGSGGDSIYAFLHGDHHQARFFDDEIRPELRHSKTGTVAMAGGGKNRNASQFYITLRDGIDYLDSIYAFIEFETKEACAPAFETMDGCLVDDRRIKVDFSQSASKEWGWFRPGRRSAKRGEWLRCGAPDYYPNIRKITKLVTEIRFKR